MRQPWLKSARIGVSLLFLTFIAALFADTRNMFPSPLAGGLLYLQFLPSLLKFLQTASLATAGFLVVLLLTALFGRVYCSTICPLGVLQDLIAWLARQSKRGRRYRFGKARNCLRYPLPLLAVILFAAGQGLLLNLLDPFSSFGRIATAILRPVVTFINNLGASLLEKFGMYALARVQTPPVGLPATMAALVILVSIGWLAARHGRLYCNTLCPVGALLGLVARFSLLRFRIVSRSCTGCKRCISVCKAGCIDLARGRIDMSRCIGCFNCVAICAHDSLDYGWRSLDPVLPVSPPDKPDQGRRRYLLHSGFSFLGVTGLAAPPPKSVVQSKPTTVPVVMSSPVSPPGSVGISHFISSCSACHLCVSACPSQVLIPSVFEYGISGLLQPRMKYQSGHCNYECTICMDICPTGALQPLPRETKKLTQIGVAKFIKENCVVYTDNTACGACSEHCPIKAVNMVAYANPRNKPLTIPEITADFCIGCGGCEHACPTRPYKAIFVDGNPVHKLAKKPVVKKPEQKPDSGEDFPF